MTTMSDSEPHPTDNHRGRVLALGADVADLMKDILDRAKELRELGVPAREWLEVVAGNLPETAARIVAGPWVTHYVAPALDGALAMLGGSPAGVAGGIIFDSAVKARQEKHAQDDEEFEGAYRVGLARARGVAKGILDDIAETPTEERTEEDAELLNLSQAFLALDADLVRLAETPSTIRMRETLRRLFSEAPKLEGAVDQAPALDVHILLRSGAPIQFSGVLSTTPEGALRLLTPVDNNFIEQFFDYSDVTSVAIVREVKKTEGSRIITSH